VDLFVDPAALFPVFVEIIPEYATRGSAATAANETPEN